MSKELVETLLFKSEGADLDFKSQQYRFTKAQDKDKGELLKDILAMANAWRDGTAYILVGCKEDPPNPAAVVGISESLDDADLQQFVQGKVQPRLAFRYEEHVCQGKTVGLFIVPKQPRPFWATSALGNVRPNAVYVRRGSSTGEASPPEVLRMYEADAGRKPASVSISLLDANGDALPMQVSVQFISFGKIEELPNCERGGVEGPFGMRMPSIGLVNRHYWRQLAEYVEVNAAAVHIGFRLANHSNFALNDCKLEVTVKDLNGQPLRAMEASSLPEWPSDDPYSVRAIRGLPNILADRAAGLKVEDRGGVATYEVRFSSLLPAEVIATYDALIVLPARAGRLAVTCRLLASELEAPIVQVQELEVAGLTTEKSFEYLRQLDEEQSTTNR